MVICSFVKEEWCYLDREVAGSDLPMPHKIWKNISRRIEEKIIEVVFLLSLDTFSVYFVNLQMVETIQIY